MKHTKPKTTVVLSFLGTLALIALWVACSKTILDRDTEARRRPVPAIESSLDQSNTNTGEDWTDCKTCNSRKCVAKFIEEMNKKYKCVITMIDEHFGWARVCARPCTPADKNEGETDTNAGLALPLDPQ